MYNSSILLIDVWGQDLNNVHKGYILFEYEDVHDTSIMTWCGEFICYDKLTCTPHNHLLFGQLLLKLVPCIFLCAGKDVSISGIAYYYRCNNYSTSVVRLCTRFQHTLHIYVWSKICV